jgi:hypothetical protein
MQAFIVASRKSSLAIRGQVGEMSSPRPLPVEATKPDAFDKVESRRRLARPDRQR